jgi:ribonuclease BN (tRNA processing enzyme)
MRLTVVGCGDAFGSGGHFNTCFWLETGKGILLIDCGASSPVALQVRGLDFARVDAVVLSHLHGDHFAGLPFLLLDAQLVSKRERPLVIAGPPGTKARVEATLEVLFPRAITNKWRFPFEFVEVVPDNAAVDIVGHRLQTTEVVHQSGAPSTALRLSDGHAEVAYSGDTEWTEALPKIARGTDLFVVECSGYSGRAPGHLTWEILKPRLPDFAARRIMLTHMNPTMLARRDEAAAAGLIIADEGVVVDF